MKMQSPPFSLLDLRERSRQHMNGLSNPTKLDMVPQSPTPQPPDSPTSALANSKRPQSDCVEQTDMIGQLEQQLYHQRQRQQLIDQLLNTIRNNWDLQQIYHLVVERLVQMMQVSRGLLMLFKYTEPRYRNRLTGNLAKTKATVVAEFQTGTQAEDSARAATDARNTTDAKSTTRTTGATDATGATNATNAHDDLMLYASECSLCQSILSGQPQILLLGETDYPLNQAHALFQLEAFPAVLMLPLENQGTILGCLVLQHCQSRFWTDDEVSFVRLIAAQLSTAIIQSHSFQQVQSVVQERTAQLQRSLEVQAKLYEKTRQQIEQLRKLNEEREEFLSSISHELLTPLTSMTLAIRMLRQPALDEQRRTKYLDILEQQCVQETHLINDMLALRKLETVSHPAQLQKLDLRQLIQDVAEAVESGCRDKDLKLTLDLPNRPLTLYSDSESLHRILLELLTNAQKYSYPDSTIELSATSEHNLPERRVALVIRNLGAGIKPEELPHIFDKFRRGQGVTQQAIQGTGLGLALVKSLVEHLDGTIAASSQPVANTAVWETCFTIMLPQLADGRMHAIA